ncbi:hypothetical protein X777_13408 [Ooceraea biroi]|uniref:Uncharacterized protein n=1 Tax=Ooceraea biroi TaxID=2015173 RepID=A0A026WYU8_OOCBI|nr:hypothetical protein X777_13408 [Ooceraea biroi]
MRGRGGMGAGGRERTVDVDVEEEEEEEEQQQEEVEVTLRLATGKKSMSSPPAVEYPSLHVTRGIRVDFRVEWNRVGRDESESRRKGILFLDDPSDVNDLTAEGTKHGARRSESLRFRVSLSAVKSLGLISFPDETIDDPAE